MSRRGLSSSPLMGTARNGLGIFLLAFTMFALFSFIANEANQDAAHLGALALLAGATYWCLR